MTKRESLKAHWANERRTTFLTYLLYFCLELKISCLFILMPGSELWLDESEELFVDDPAEVSWLAELLRGVSVDAPLMLPSFCWAG